MNPQISHHPSPALLEKFQRGLLAPGPSAAVAAHLELCGHCNCLTAPLLEQVAEEWLETAETPVSGEFDDLLTDILEQPRQVEAPVRQVVSDTIHLPECSVQVPEILAKAAGDALHWRKLPGGINHANVAIDRKARCDFLYMKPGSQIPPHRHQGMEITLVLDGSFSDEAGRYQVGDFIVRSGDDCHRAMTDQGCLCFTVLDKPVILTSGFARLFNPVSRRFFNRLLR
jgi:putative transcriptional regulator